MKFDSNSKFLTCQKFELNSNSNLNRNFRFANRIKSTYSNLKFDSTINSNEINVYVEYIFIDELTINASNVIFNNMSIFIKYIILIEMRQTFAERKLNENCQIFFVAFEFLIAFEFQRSIIIDSNLRKNIR